MRRWLCLEGRAGWSLRSLRLLCNVIGLSAALALLAFRSAVMAFWTSYADWIYVVVSSTAMLLIIILVLRPKP